MYKDMLIIISMLLVEEMFSLPLQITTTLLLEISLIILSMKVINSVIITICLIAHMSETITLMLP